MPEKSFGEALRDLILARYPSQRQFAQEIGMGPEYLSRILRGHVERPEDETLARMAEALGVSAGYLRALDRDRPAGDAPVGPRVVVVERPGGGRLELAMEVVVAYVEGYPDPRLQARLVEWRDRHDRETYERLCAKTFVAWGSNMDLGLSGVELAAAR